MSAGLVKGKDPHNVTISIFLGASQVKAIGLNMADIFAIIGKHLSSSTFNLHSLSFFKTYL